MAVNDTINGSPDGQHPPIERQRSPGWTRLTSQYLKDLPRQLDDILAILEVKNYAGVKSHAHRMKGTSGTYLLRTISRGAAQIEQCAGDGNAHGVATAVGEVRRLVELEVGKLGSQAMPAADAAGGRGNE